MMLDAVEEVERESPAILGGVTAAAIFAMAGLAFRSLLIPLRLIATIVTTLAIVLAAAVVTFQVARKPEQRARANLLDRRMHAISPRGCQRRLTWPLATIVSM